MAERQLTQEYVRSLFHYDPETGVLVWKERPREHFRKEADCKTWNTKNAGNASGGVIGTGYVYAGIDGKRYGVHRIAWLWMTGEYPENEIDHIDGNRVNNRFANLRHVHRATNRKNMAARPNRSGVQGVYWHSHARLWHACIHVDGKKISLGYFKDLESAATAKADANRRYGFHENHGRTSA